MCKNKRRLACVGPYYTLKRRKLNRGQNKLLVKLLFNFPFSLLILFVFLEANENQPINLQQLKANLRKENWKRSSRLRFVVHLELGYVHKHIKTELKITVNHCKAHIGSGVVLLLMGSACLGEVSTVCHTIIL